MDIPVARFASKDDWAVDENAMLEAAQAQMPGPTPMSERIAELPNVDPWYTVHGKDLMEILRLGLQRTLGDLPTSVGVTQLARSLRLAMPDPDLQATGTWHDMRAWEARNPPYAVLPKLETDEEEPN